MLESLKEQIAGHIITVLHENCDAAEANDVAEDILDLIKSALAEAEARGRRQGLEEAAKVCEERIRGDMTPEDYEFECATRDIRSLATTPTETQTPQATEHGDASL